MRNDSTSYYTFFKTNNIIMILIDPDSMKIVDANQAACDFYHYSEDEISQLNIRDIIVREEKDYSVHKCSNGHLFDVEISKGTILLEGKKRTYLNIYDITEKRKIEETLRMNEERLSFAMDNCGDGVWDWNVETDEVFYSRSWREILGYDDADRSLNKNWESRLHPEDKGRVLNELKQHLEGRTAFYSCEYRFNASGKEYIWILDRGKVVSRSADGKPLRVVGTDMDITKRKEMEEIILFSGFHDELTGLYNRRFFNEELFRLDTDRQLPLSIIIGDINGLKLTNDIFGHLEGDRILISAANIMKKVFRADDIIARWGGDEFIILLPRTSRKKARDLCKKIQLECLKGKNGNLKTSISLGYATKEAPGLDMMKVLKNAENLMYKKKLVESIDFRNSIIATTRKMLRDKSAESKNQEDRIKAFCQHTASAMKISEILNDELNLLASLHDIGKIAINTAILNKPSKLDEVEWQEMMRHSEIGYQVVKAAPEFSKIAEYILAHHERWDGAGYPRGLKGEEIPLVARILSVSAAYDAMTNDSPYRKAMPKNDAVEELKKNAGSQFDPDVVRFFTESVVNELQ